VYAGSPDAKERVRQAVDIVDLVGQHIDLRRQGRNYVGICPWHPDSRPSLQVNPDRQSWKCWVCDIGGDIFSFVMKRESVEFREAIEMLADRAGIVLAPAGKPVAPGSPDDKSALYRVMAWAAQQYHEHLLESVEAAGARDYLARRGITPESFERYKLGFAPPGWQWLLDRAARQSIPVPLLNATGLVTQSEKSGRWLDRFRGRAIFPILDLQSRPIALGGRILPELADEKTAKYINSPETKLFSKSEQLYGLNWARDAVVRERNVMVMEGYTDVVITQQAGIGQAVAVLGTALGPRHLPLLKRFTDRITLILDGDSAGQRRANEVLELFITNQVDLRIVTLPDNLDPCDYVLQHGADALIAHAGEAPDAWEHRIRMETRGIDLLRDTHAANRALESLLTTLARSSQGPPAGQAAQRIREQQILNRLAREFRLDEGELRERVLEQRAKATAPIAPRAPEPVASLPSEPKPRLEPVERELFEMLLQVPAYVPVVLDRIDVTELRTSTARDIYRQVGQLAAAEVAVDFSSLLLAFDDPQMKSLLVELDESGRSKHQVDYNMLLEDLTLAFSRRITEETLRRQQAALESEELSEQEQLDTLLAIMKHKLELMGE
jgi:DNA primase